MSKLQAKLHYRAGGFFILRKNQSSPADFLPGVPDDKENDLAERADALQKKLRFVRQKLFFGV